MHAYQRTQRPNWILPASYRHSWSTGASRPWPVLGEFPTVEIQASALELYLARHPRSLQSYAYRTPSRLPAGHIQTAAREEGERHLAPPPKVAVNRWTLRQRGASLRSRGPRRR